MYGRLVGAFDEHGLVADRLLLLVDRADLRAHAFGADLHVADGVIAVGLGVALPDIDPMRHQLAHRRLVVVVAHDAARDARRAGADRRLVDDEDIRARAFAAAFSSGRGERPCSGRECRRR